MARDAGGTFSRLCAEYTRVLRALPTRYRGVVLLLLAGNIAGAALEVLALWLLGSLMSAIAPGTTQPAPSVVSTALGTGAVTTAWVVAATTLAFLLKNLFMGALEWGEATFSFSLQSRFADKALTNLLALDYAVVARRPASEYLTLLTTDLRLVIEHYVLPSFTVASETFLLVSILGFLFWLQPVLTGAFVLFVGGAAWVVIHWSRRVMGTAGARRQALEDDRMCRLREVLTHLREVHVYRAGGHARERLLVGLEQLARVYRAFRLMAGGPRFALEVVLVAVLMAAIIFGLRNDERHTLIVSLGVFTAAGFRFLIGANRLIMSTQGIRFARPAMVRILGMLEEAPANTFPIPTAPRPTPARTLSLRAVRYDYPGSSVPALENVDLSIACGTLVGIKGGSGTGKTTLLEVLSGLRRPTAGDVLVDDVPLGSPQEFFGVVAYAGQSPAIFSDTIRGNVALGVTEGNVDDAQVWAALEGAHLAAFVRSLPGQLDALLGEGTGFNMSGGQAQRLALARALYADCPFLLLDEPTSALDPATEADVVSTLREIASKRGVLVVSHRPHPLQCCDAVYEMREGAIHRI
jgi:ABC-type multidrug transport system fused ATPase/permease subunit